MRDPVIARAERTVREARRILAERPPGGVEIDVDELTPRRIDLESTPIGRIDDRDEPQPEIKHFAQQRDTQWWLEHFHNTLRDRAAARRAQVAAQASEATSDAELNSRWSDIRAAAMNVYKLDTRSQVHQPAPVRGDRWSAIRTAAVHSYGLRTVCAEITE
jgi:hypothetical protein